MLHIFDRDSDPSMPTGLSECFGKTLDHIPTTKELVSFKILYENQHFNEWIYEIVVCERGDIYEENVISQYSYDMDPSEESESG